jgi:hypothetical protein
VRRKVKDDLRTTAFGSHSADVTSWRREQLESVGFEPQLALRLAASSVDLHSLIALVEHGCPPQLAARIMAPLEQEETWC